MAILSDKFVLNRVQFETRRFQFRSSPPWATLEGWYYGFQTGRGLDTVPAVCCQRLSAGPCKNIDMPDQCGQNPLLCRRQPPFHPALYDGSTQVGGNFQRRG